MRREKEVSEFDELQFLGHEISELIGAPPEVEIRKRMNIDGVQQSSREACIEILAEVRCITESILTHHQMLAAKLAKLVAKDMGYAILPGVDLIRGRVVG